MYVQIKCKNFNLFQDYAMFWINQRFNLLTDLNKLFLLYPAIIQKSMQIINHIVFEIENNCIVVGKWKQLNTRHSLLLYYSFSFLVFAVHSDNLFSFCQLTFQIESNLSSVCCFDSWYCFFLLSIDLLHNGCWFMVFDERIQNTYRQLKKILASL